MLKYNQPKHILLKSINKKLPILNNIQSQNMINNMLLIHFY